VALAPQPSAISGHITVWASSPSALPVKGDGDREIEATAIHNHVLDDKPLYFMHFWADDDAKKLASSSRGG
jgi:hypothetical protein